LKQARRLSGTGGTGAEPVRHRCQTGFEPVAMWSAAARVIFSHNHTLAHSGTGGCDAGNFSDRGCMRGNSCGVGVIGMLVAAGSADRPPPIAPTPEASTNTGPSKVCESMRAALKCAPCGTAQSCARMRALRDNQCLVLGDWHGLRPSRHCFSRISRGHSSSRQRGVASEASLSAPRPAQQRAYRRGAGGPRDGPPGF